MKGALFHSDQGWQYQRKEFGDILKGYGRIQTMSRKGNCHDNSVMEVLFDNISLLGSSFGVQNISTNHSPGKIRKEDGFSVLEKYRKIYFFSSLSLADFSFSLFPFVASIMASVRRAHEYLRVQRTMTIGKPGRTNSFLFRFTNQFFHQS